MIPSSSTDKFEAMSQRKQGCGVRAEMTEVKRSQLKQAVESRHGGKATFVQSVPVLEMRGGQTISNASVSVFDLRGSTSGAFRGYAWVPKSPDGQQTFFALLHTPWVVGPTAAVRAAIAAEARFGNSPLFRPIGSSPSVVLPSFVATPTLGTGA
jgi:hypothetical protein